MEKKLTTFEASCIVAGNGIGGGLMALPYLSARVGIVGTILVLMAAWALTAVLHIFVAEMSLNAKNGSSLLTVVNEFLFTGKWQKRLSSGFFLLLFVGWLFNIAAYVIGGADIITSLLPVSPLVAKLMFYAVAIVVPALGLKAVGLSEKVTVAVMLAFVTVLFGISMLRGDNTLSLTPESISGVLALYGLSMFSFNALVAVPQVVDGLDRSAKSVKAAIFKGIGMNLFMSLALCISVLATSKEITKVAIVGLSESLGMPIKIVGSLLVLFAMFTSFWSVSLSLSEMVHAQIKFRGKKSLVFVMTTAPCVLIAAAGNASFVSFLGIVGGAMAVFMALLLLPAYRNSIPQRATPPLLGKLSDNSSFFMIVALFYLLMAVGAFFAAF